MTTVKPLEWTAEDNGEFIAMSPVGWYHIGFPCQSWNLTMPSGDVPSFGDDLEAAKAAAFADYSARIMSAIEPAGPRTMEDIHREQLQRDRLKPAGVGVETREQKLEDALRNLLGVYDTPLSRRRFPQDDFMKEAIDTARAALKGDEQ